MRLVISLFICLIASACNPKTTETTTEQADSKPANLSANELEGEWHMITEVDGEWVLYYPCDADNTFIQLKADSIVIGWGQDATAGKIENRAVDGDKLTLAVNDSYAVNTYQLRIDQAGYTEWWLWEDAEAPSRFIHASQKSIYKEVKQPCKECWEDCDEEQ
jgi:hypothetical protein